MMMDKTTKWNLVLLGLSVDSTDQNGEGEKAVCRVSKLHIVARHRVQTIQSSRTRDIDDCNLTMCHLIE
jgi:hypothetical protein